MADEAWQLPKEYVPVTFRPLHVLILLNEEGGGRIAHLTWYSIDGRPFTSYSRISLRQLERNLVRKMMRAGVL